MIWREPNGIQRGLIFRFEQLAGFWKPGSNHLTLCDGFPDRAIARLFPADPLMCAPSGAMSTASPGGRACGSSRLSL